MGTDLKSPIRFQQKKYLKPLKDIGNERIQIPHIFFLVKLNQSTGEMVWGGGVLIPTLLLNTCNIGDVWGGGGKNQK